MSILRRNLEVFCAANPQYKDWLTNTPVPQGVYVERRNGHDCLIDNGVLIDSTDPSFNNKPLFKKKLVNLAVIQGFGLGENVMAVGRKFYSRKLGYIIIEPSVDRFIAALSVKDFTSLLAQPGILWMVGRTTSEVYNQVYMAMFDLYLGPRRKNSEYYPHPVIYRKHKEYFDEAKNQIIQGGNIAYNSFGHQDDCFLGIGNTYTNLPSILSTGAYKDLENLFKGVPALVVATGPSLNKTIDKIKKLEGKCIIIACDASYKILLDNGIVPHFAVTLERVELTTKFFKNIKSPIEDRQTSLVTFPLSPKKTLDVFDGPIFLAYRNYNYFKYLEARIPKGIESCGHGVSHLACKLADQLGCSIITLVGQDLCYSPDLQTHADGVSHGDTQKRTLEELKEYAVKDKKGNIHTVKGNLEPAVISNDLWLYFMKEFITEQEATNAPIINCTLGGAQIPAVPWADIDEVSKSWIEQKDFFPEILRVYKEPEKSKLDLDPLFSEFKSLDQLLKKGQKALRRASKPNQKFSKRKKFISELEDLKMQLSRNIQFLGYIYESDVKLFMGLEEQIYTEPLTENNIEFHISKWSEWVDNLRRITGEVEDLIIERVKDYNEVTGLPS